MKTKVVELKFNIIVDVEDDATNEDILEDARQELIDIIEMGIEVNLIGIKDFEE